jgi:CBS-domain-containing membrane protein
MADEAAVLKDIMTESVVSLKPDDSLKDAYELFQRYGFRAVPILDEAKKCLGAIVYKDVMGLKHRFVA